jgi:hypothetical protein
MAVPPIRLSKESVHGFAAIPFASTLAFKQAIVANDKHLAALYALTFKTSDTIKGYGSRGIHRVPRSQEKICYLPRVEPAWSGSRRDFATP